MPALTSRQVGLHIAALLCAAVALAAYYNSLQCGLVFDDKSAIRENKDLRPELRSWWELLRHDFWGATLTHKESHKSYRPLTVATFRLNYMLHELQPLGYHLVNVLLHSAVCYLYVLLCGVVFSEVWPALIAGLLFTVHPIHIEAVTSVVGRAETLSAVFFISAFFCFRRSAQHQPNGCTGWHWVAVCLLLTVCSLLSKEQGITVVAVCVVYDFFCLQKMDLESSLVLLTTFPRNPLPKHLRGFVKRTLVLAVFTIAMLVMRFRVMGGAPKVFDKQINPPVALDTPYRQLSWLYLSFVNSWLLLNPFNLCADWRFGTAPIIISLIDPHNLLTILTLTTVTYIGIFSISGSNQRRKIIAFAISLLLLPYIPASNLFFPVGFVVAERVLYLPSMGFCLLVGYGAYSVLKSANHVALRAIFTLFLLSLLATHALKTTVRNQDWVSEHTIYASAVKINPRHGPMLTNLGAVYVVDKSMKNYTIAEKLFKHCVDVAPEYPRGLSNYAGLLEATSRKDKAEKVLRRAIEMGLRHTSANQLENIYHLLKMLQSHAGREEDALELCDFAMQYYPTTAHLFLHRGKILTKLNRTREAVSDLEIAVQTPVFLADVNYNLGLAYVAAGSTSKAVNSFKAELAGNPGNLDSVLQLGMLLQRTAAGDPGKLREAQTLLQQVTVSKPRHMDGLYSLAQVYLNLQNLQKSEDVFQKIIQLSPDHKDALYYLGHVYYKGQRYRQAVDVWRRLMSVDPDHRDVVTQLKMAEKYSK